MRLNAFKFSFLFVDICLTIWGLQRNCLTSWILPREITVEEQSVIQRSLNTLSWLACFFKKFNHFFRINYERLIKSWINKSDQSTGRSGISIIGKLKWKRFLPIITRLVIHSSSSVVRDGRWVTHHQVLRSGRTCTFEPASIILKVFLCFHLTVIDEKFLLYTDKGLLEAMISLARWGTATLFRNECFSR